MFFLFYCGGKKCNWNLAGSAFNVCKLFILVLWATRSSPHIPTSPLSQVKPKSFTTHQNITYFLSYLLLSLPPSLQPNRLKSLHGNTVLSHNPPHITVCNTFFRVNLDWDGNQVGTSAVGRHAPVIPKAQTSISDSAVLWLTMMQLQLSLCNFLWRQASCPVSIPQASVFHRRFCHSRRHSCYWTEAGGKSHWLNSVWPLRSFSLCVATKRAGSRAGCTAVSGCPLSPYTQTHKSGVCAQGWDW